MKIELDKAYNPQENEDKIYQKWEESGYFNPDNLSFSEQALAYTIVLPPPNVTDKLHMGHAATLAIEDLLIRYHRLRGDRALWLPGTDHAAIATQNVVEKKLLREKQQTRHGLGRTKFLEEVWAYLKTTQSTILHQTRKLGASLDWSRQTFTLDEARQLAVRTMFKEMYDAGAIYRGERIVNWCPRCASTLADDEVEYKEQDAKLYTFQYSPDFPIAISTTRPETKLGDTAVAVNPKDERYKKYIGQEFSVDFCGQPLKLKIIGDRHVDSEFGTGALGVTPAHSLADWQMAEANQLPVVKVIGEDARLLPGFGKYSGRSVLEAREEILANLEAGKLLHQTSDIKNNLSVCYRCGTAIEPLPSKQWFVAVDKKLKRLGNKSLKEAALAVAEKKAIKFVPERFTKRYLDWMNDLHDWCISRQIWFGHQIPVWYRGEEVFVGLEAPVGDGWQPDQDTLDTWFSSGMWTFSTLGWPQNLVKGKKMGDLAKFHPTQVLETGYEIITLWVSRMIMMSLFAMGEVPFETVYLHGMILDKDGKKMSKSKGNGVDPLDMVAKFGADATRLSLLMGSTPGNDARFSEDKIEAKKNFINKLWNISRFITSTVSEEALALNNDKLPPLETDADKWIIFELEHLLKKVTDSLDKFDFSQAAEELSEFTWNKLADWYLEIAKFEKGKDQLLIYLLRNLLKLWHPFIPFVTETIWQSFNDSLLLVGSWPESKLSSRADKEGHFSYILMNQVIEVIKKIREARSEHRIEPKKKIKAVIYTNNNQNLELIKEQAILIKNLKTGLEEVEIKARGEKISGAIFVMAGEMEIYLLGVVDENKEKDRLAKEKNNLEKLIISQSQKLSNADFVSRAPQKIVKAEQEKLRNYQGELEKISKLISTL